MGVTSASYSGYVLKRPDSDTAEVVRYQAVAVTWADSVAFGAGGSPWAPLDDVLERAGDPAALECTSIGHLIHEDERSLTLALSVAVVSDDGSVDVGGALTIPRCAISSVVRLRPA